MPKLVVKGHESVDALAYSPTGEYLASVGDGELKLWNPNLGTVLHTLPLGGVGSVAFSPNGPILAAASPSDQPIRLWNVKTRELVGTIEDARRIRNVAFSRDGQRIITGSNKAVKIWDVRSGEQLEVLQKSGSTSVTLAPTTNLVAFDDGRVIKLRHLDSGRELLLVGNSKMGVDDLKFTPDGQILASASGRDDMILWNTATGRPARAIAQKGVSGILSLDVSPDGRSLLTADWLGAVRLFDVLTGEQRFTLREYGGPIARSAVFSPDGQTVVAGFEDGSVVFWRTGRLKEWADAAKRFEVAR